MTIMDCVLLSALFPLSLIQTKADKQLDEQMDINGPGQFVGWIEINTDM